MLLKKLPAASALVLACWGCASLGRSPVDRPQAEAREALAGLLEDYQAPRPEPFFARFDQSRFPAFESYRDRVRDFLLRNHQIVLDVIVDSAVSDGQDVSIAEHWNRSWVNAVGGHVLKEGHGALVFRRRPSGELLLSAVQGDSPF